MRRKPAHCSNAFGPRRGTFLSDLRERNGPLASRCSTIFCARLAPMPDTRARSGVEAVLASTPTAFTQSSTTASSEYEARRHDQRVVLRMRQQQIGERLQAGLLGYLGL